ncbi:group 1 glycosyl transferase [Neobacillus bataviensis LMG 21833]|uniref:Group 1 glycosyl transferase n=2 Tax=Neobacillus bataviensis TaxID=220685 RepID=K6DSW4_9BACI|nr:group 1 glycosyl transferase [Neobacillus bataviensis LMG 21833]
MYINKHRVIETVSSFLPYSANWLYELFNIQLDKPLFIAEYREQKDNFKYDNLIYLKEKGNKDIRLITELKYYYLLNRKFHNENIIIHSHFGPKGYFDYLFFKKWNKKSKHIVSFYGYDLSTLLTQEKWRNRYLNLSKEIDLFLVLGKSMKNKLLKIGIAEEKIKIFHLGVDLTKMPRVIRSINQEKTVKFITVGRFTEKKAIPLTIEAFKRYLKFNPNAQLIIVGESDGSLEQENEKAKILKEITPDIEEKVIFKGILNYERLINTMGESDILLHPSVTSKDGDEEGTPLVIINAMALGIPVISTLHSDIPEIITDGYSGKLVEEGNLSRLIDAMIMLSSDSKLYTKISESSRIVIENQFNLKKQSAALVNIYEEITKP